MNQLLWVWLSVVLLAASAGTVGTAQAPTDVKIELAYVGDGNVEIPSAGLHLWASETHEFEARLAGNATPDATKVCLVTNPGGRELTCRQIVGPLDNTATVPLAVDAWPGNLTGAMELSAILRTQNGSLLADGRTLSVTVLRKRGDLDGDGVTNQREVAAGTGLRTSDTDGDNLSDLLELQTYRTDPTSADTDLDKLSDHAEVTTHRTDPNAADGDGDGLQDGREVDIGTNPNKADSDGDSVEDNLELNTYGTDPTDPDTDGDGLDDGAEIRRHETNPGQPDTDGDGLSDNLEVNTYGTNPSDPDTDGDGLDDGVETSRYQTDPARSDSDGDGLTDGIEVNRHGTVPTNGDTDNDGLDDGAEVNRYRTNPNSADTDGDGRNDRVEVRERSIVNWFLFRPAFIVGLVLVIASGAALYRTGYLSKTSNQPQETSAHRAAPASVEGDKGAEELPPELLSNEDRVLSLLAQHGGRLPQAEIVEQTGWSKSKVSRVLTQMDEDERIVKIDVGGGNMVTRPEDVPPAARSPFRD